ncbi:FtsX-like permease family protein [Elongatibacter sediminis]|uniref:FtsX-like permease family protein n=1 Tax=Elongatibacter sediminis TaxID=3119006 RepID=A0AAW9R906_9GAMM
MRILHALLAHYRRHPVQAVFLLTSIVIANALLVGTQLINAQARASYARGEQLLDLAPIGEIAPVNPAAGIPESDYLRLRLAGFDFVVPALGTQVRTADGTALELLAVDALALPRAGPGRPASAAPTPAGGQHQSAAFGGFSLPPYQVLIAPGRLRQLGLADGARIRLSDGLDLPPLRVAPDANLGHRLMLDIGALQSALGAPGTLSHLLVFPADPGRLAALRHALPANLHYVPADTAPDPGELTRSFHLNLAAMGLLAFVVGVFLTFNALAFTYTDRGELLRRLRLSGVSRLELGAALIAELVLFLGAGTALGAWLGMLLAALLLPGVGRTLAQLYEVYIAYPDTLAPGALWLPLAMTATAAVACVLHPMRQSLSAPLLGRAGSQWRLSATARRDRRGFAAGLVLLAAAGLAAQNARGTGTALAGMAALLLGTALCLPAVLRGLLTVLARMVPARHARSRWLLADSRWLLGPASLALMAMVLALVANSGLNTMIGSFRAATADWLDQRLAAPLYLRDADRNQAIDDWLATNAPDIDRIDRYRTRLETRRPDGSAVRIEVVTLPGDPAWSNTVQRVDAADAAAERFDSGQGLYISERAWRLDGWAIGDTVNLCASVPPLTVVGIYHDYGNPHSQWMITPELFAHCWPQLAPVSSALRGPEDTDWPGVRLALVESLGLAPDDIIDQAGLKAAGIATFDRTFLVTDALNLLTLLVAGIGVFCAVSAIHHHRIFQQALLASLGLTAAERGALMLLQWGLLGVLALALVWPFGMVLAAYLASVVTPAAFGWSFPLRLDWTPFARLALLSTSSLVLAVLWPSIRLLRTPPAVMLREERA